MTLSRKLKLIAELHAYECKIIDDNSIYLTIYYSTGHIAKVVKIGSMFKLYSEMGY